MPHPTIPAGYEVRDALIRPSDAVIDQSVMGWCLKGGWNRERFITFSPTGKEKLILDWRSQVW